MLLPPQRCSACKLTPICVGDPVGKRAAERALRLTPASLSVNHSRSLWVPPLRRQAKKTAAAIDRRNNPHGECFISTQHGRRPHSGGVKQLTCKQVQARKGKAVRLGWAPGQQRAVQRTPRLLELQSAGRPRAQGLRPGCEDTGVQPRRHGRAQSGCMDGCGDDCHGPGAADGLAGSGSVSGLPTMRPSDADSVQPSGVMQICP